LKLLGLREHPFAAGHDPRFLHSTAERDEALARLRHGLRGGESFLLVTGEPGIGKTSLVLEALDDEGAAAAFLSQSSIEPSELLEEVCIRFEINVPKGASKPQAMSRLERHLNDLRSKGLLPVLALDDAQEASAELLEELRVLANLEVDGRPMLQIVLMGLPELEQLLEASDMARVRQRVATHCQVQPLTSEETEDYLHARIAAAGGNASMLFPKESCREIYSLTGGVPRAINTLAGEAMLKASLASARSVSPAHVQSAAGGPKPRAKSQPAPDERATAAPSIGEAARGGPAATANAPAPNPPAAKPVPAEAVAPKSAPAEAPPPKAAQPRQPEPEIAYPESPPTEEMLRSATDTKEWVARFVDPDRPLRIGGQILAERAAEAARKEWDEANPMELEADAGPVPMPKPRRKRRVKALPGSRRGTHRGTRGHVPLAIGGLLVAGVALFLGMRWARHSPTGAPVRAVAMDSRAGSPSTSSAASTTMAPSKNVKLTKRSAASAAANPLATAGPGAETPPPKPVRRGIEAARYLDSERAEAERTLLAETTGLSVRVIQGTDGGAPVYRVVVGSFGSRKRAQAAMNDLVDRGLVDEARLVTLPESGSATP
jgi:type II secretory pathway predicted ATPase ExeA